MWGILGAGYPVTKPNSKDPGEGGGDDRLQPGAEDSEAPTEVVVMSSGTHSHNEDVILNNCQPIWKEKIPCGWNPVDDSIPD